MAVYCLHFSSPASLLFWEDYWVVCIIACSGADCSNRAEFQKAQTAGLIAQDKGTSSGGNRKPQPRERGRPQGGITGPRSPKPLPTSAFQPPHLGRGWYQPGRSQLRNSSVLWASHTSTELLLFASEREQGAHHHIRKQRRARYVINMGALGTWGGGL